VLRREARGLGRRERLLADDVLDLVGELPPQQLPQHAQDEVLLVLLVRLGKVGRAHVAELQARRLAAHEEEVHRLVVGELGRARERLAARLAARLGARRDLGEVALGDRARLALVEEAAQPAAVGHDAEQVVARGVHRRVLRLGLHHLVDARRVPVLHAGGGRGGRARGGGARARRAAAAKGGRA